MPLDQAAEHTINPDAAADWMRQYQQQKRRCDEENGVLRSIVKRAKSDGMPIKAMRDTIAASKLDPEEVERDLRDRLRLMAIKHIVIDRDSLFDWDTAVTAQTCAADDTWDAAEKGYRAGRHGQPAEECPYDLGSPFAVVWRTDWAKGQASIARELGKNAAQASTARERPARGQRVMLPLDVDEAPRKRTRGPGKKNGAAAARDQAEPGVTAH